jgi:hypothetical protein
MEGVMSGFARYAKALSLSVMIAFTFVGCSEKDLDLSVEKTAADRIKIVNREDFPVQIQDIQYMLIRLTPNDLHIDGGGLTAGSDRARRSVIARFFDCRLVWSLQGKSHCPLPGVYASKNWIHACFA